MINDHLTDPSQHDESKFLYLKLKGKSNNLWGEVSNYSIYEDIEKIKDPKSNYITELIGRIESIERLLIDNSGIIIQPGNKPHQLFEPGLFNFEGQSESFDYHDQISHMDLLEQGTSLKYAGHPNTRIVGVYFFIEHGFSKNIHKYVCLKEKRDVPLIQIAISKSRLKLDKIYAEIEAESHPKS